MTIESARSEQSTLRERQRAFREAEIVRTASELLATHGCRSFTMDEIARRLAISKATLYAHFRSKDQLVQAALDRATTIALASLDGDATGGPSTEALEATVQFLTAKLLSMDGMKETDGDHALEVPCCLRELDCPFSGWSQVEALLCRIHPDGPERGRETSDALRAIAGVTRSRIVREGRKPQEEDHRSVLRRVLLEG